MKGDNITGEIAALPIAAKVCSLTGLTPDYVNAQFAHRNHSIRQGIAAQRAAHGGTTRWAV